MNTEGAQRQLIKTMDENNGYPLTFFWLYDTSRFDSAKKILKEKYGLVEPAVPKTDCLVWEDDNHIGRYRITFMNHANYGPMAVFRYWETRLTPEIAERNPMLEPLFEMASMLEPYKITDHRFKEIVLKK